MRSIAHGISVLVVFILVAHDGPFAMAQGEPDRSPRGLVRSLGNTGYRHPGAIQHACLDPTERTLFTLSEKGVYAWDLRTGESHLLFDAERVRNALSISPDGHLLASIAGDDVALWDARTGAPWSAHSTRVIRQAMSPSSRTARASSSSGKGRSNVDRSMGTRTRSSARRSRIAGRPTPPAGSGSPHRCPAGRRGKSPFTTRRACGRRPCFASAGRSSVSRRRACCPCCVPGSPTMGATSRSPPRSGRSPSGTSAPGRS